MNGRRRSGSGRRDEPRRRPSLLSVLVRSSLLGSVVVVSGVGGLVATGLAAAAGGPTVAMGTAILLFVVSGFVTTAVLVLEKQLKDLRDSAARHDEVLVQLRAHIWQLGHRLGSGSVVPGIPDDPSSRR